MATIKKIVTNEDNEELHPNYSLEQLEIIANYVNSSYVLYDTQLTEQLDYVNVISEEYNSLPIGNQNSIAFESQEGAYKNNLFDQDNQMESLRINPATDDDDDIFGTKNADVIFGLKGNDHLSGAGGNDRLYGNEGDDELSGDAGNDVLSGGEGNDTLYGYTGNDIYVYSRGDGHDLIVDRNGDNNPYAYDENKLYGLKATETSTIKFEQSINPADVIVTRDEKDLILTISGTNGEDKITLHTWFYHAFRANGTVDKTWQVKFEDGTVWNGEDLLEKSNTVSIGSDYFTGTLGVDVIQNGNGDDFLSGRAGNDVYKFNRGDDHDTIYDYDKKLGNTDVLEFGNGITSADISVSRGTWFENKDLHIQINGTTDVITIKDWYANKASKVEQVKFSDGTIWEVPMLLDKAKLGGTILDDYLEGTKGADNLAGGQGSDEYIVNHKDDLVIERMDQGEDEVRSKISYTLTENVENLYLTGMASINGTGNDLDNYVVGNNAANVLLGEKGNDYLLGGNGNDTLYGGAGNDTLYDVYGKNKLIGGEGDDLYIANNVSLIAEKANEGIDTIKVHGVSYKLTDSSNIENLIITLGKNVTGTGNNSDNILTAELSTNTTLVGEGGNDSLSSGYIMIGGSGNDTLQGNDFATNIFVFNPLDSSANGGLGLDSILDFITDGFNDSDIIDLSGMFAEGTVSADNINQYMRMNNTYLQIDRDGGGNSFVNLVNIVGTNITTANLDELLTAGQIIV